MSKRYPGGIITKSPATPTGPFENGTAPGVWTLEQQMQYQQQGIWPTAGLTPNYIEEVFSTYLYTGNGSTQTITNGIDLSTKGGLVWAKQRDGVTYHQLRDTVRGGAKELYSNDTSGQGSSSAAYTFLSTGYSIGGNDDINLNTKTYVSWTFRKQPKFFDVVTWTGDGTGVKTVTHNLGSVPGCIIVKHTSEASSWWVYHRGTVASGSPAQDQYLRLETTDQIASASIWNNYAPTSTNFQVNSGRNTSGQTYVAYIFAHDAGGFGLTGTENVITCGYYLGNGAAAGQAISLGYEPQYLMTKIITDTGDWNIADNMRGWTLGSTATSTDASLQANLSANETQISLGYPTATGFQVVSDNTNTSGRYYIYIAIRRGPMKVPTVGTSVFGMSARSGTGAVATVTGGQTDDAVLVKNRGSAVASLFSSRLTGTGYLVTSATDAEVAAGTTILQANPWDVMDGVKVGTTSTITNASANTYINYLFKRAPSVFDVVCYTGTGSATTQTHNLAAVPELMIVKRRNVARYWAVYASPLGATKWLQLETVDPVQTDTMWNDTTPTASVFSIGTYNGVNGSGDTYVAYLFATCAGVSKVGSYTGTGTTLQINCVFTGGARFVLIKRTDSTGDWYVWDSARGIVSGNDPYLLLNSTAAEVTGTDYVDTYNAGFEISSTAPAAINASAGSFIFLAIA